jgi:hypothetical protein
MKGQSVDRRVWMLAGTAVAVAVATGLLASHYGLPGARTRALTASPAPEDPHPAAAPPAATATSTTTPAPAAPAVPALASPEQARCPIRFQDVTEETGITFVHTDGSSGRRYIVESVSTGLASFDYDGDGLIDLYFPNGAPLRGATPEKPPHHALYKNLGGWRFKDVTFEAGVACTAYGLGATVGDYDNDGHPDLYLSNFGPKILYRNNGDGTFTDVTRAAGVADGDKTGAGVCFLDADGDGLLDLYVANYVRFSYENHVSRTLRGVPWYSGPRDYQFWPDTLFHNNGDGTFTDVSQESGVASVVGPGMGMVCLDYDGDGHTDVFVGNDAVGGNFLFHNDGTGKFKEVGLAAGIAFNMYGAEMSSMAAECADYDNDGWLDVFVTDYQPDLPVLYQNLGRGAFEDVTMRTNVGDGSWQYAKWGAGLVDFDNDGLRDVFIACGHIQDNVELVDSSTTYKCHNIVLRNVGGKFVNVSNACGVGSLPRHVGRGAVFDDLDNDGDIDVVILNSRERPTVLRNMYRELGGKNHYLQVRLQGVKSNRDGVGAKVKVVAGDLVLVDEVHSGRSYQSHFGSRLHFGLGNRGRVDRIEVRWLGGGSQVVEDVAADQLVTIAEGRGLFIRPLGP